jgi:pimeloyl-ACP methyl ester carboxylesterase
MTACAVVVPGIMGCVMKLGNEIVWPGSVLNTFVTKYAKMDELLDPRTRPTDVIRSVFVFSQYATLLDDLERCGFHEQAQPPTLFVCAYDWRQANEKSAVTLADLLDKIDDLHGGQAEVYLIAHSMGGLVSRYYLESGKFSERPGFVRVKQLITLGTPHRGAPKALSAVLGMEREAFLDGAQVKRLASDTRYPSAYQLLPHKGEPFAWNADAARRYAPENVYAADWVKKLGLVQANLDAAMAFHAVLAAGKPPVPYFCFVGTQQATISLVQLLAAATQPLTPVEPEDSGDGTVPSWSAALPGVQGRQVGGKHGTLYKNGDLRQILGVLIGAPGVLAGEAERVEVAVRNLVAEPEESVHAVLSFPSRTEIIGELRIERPTLGPAGAVVSWAQVGPSLPITYRGLASERLGVVFDAPALRGAYRVAYYPEGAAEPAGSDELFVQSGT